MLSLCDSYKPHRYVDVVVDDDAFLCTYMTSISLGYFFVVVVVSVWILTKGYRELR